MTATVIIPTTGSSDLLKAVKSVLSQSYSTTCYLVIDGSQYYDKTIDCLPEDVRNQVEICLLPYNVGANGFYGHRIYAAFTHLVNCEYVLYLDQDNWFEPDHVESCIKTIKQNKLDWCYSLRNIYRGENFICQDNCESLGKWKSYNGNNHVDTNTYCIKTEVAVRLASSWHGGWGQDRAFLSDIAKNFPKWICSGKYTVNYRVEGNAGSVTAEFFESGNKIMEKLYNGKFPWSNPA